MPALEVSRRANLDASYNTLYMSAGSPRRCYIDRGTCTTIIRDMIANDIAGVARSLRSSVSDAQHSSELEESWSTICPRSVSGHASGREGISFKAVRTGGGQKYLCLNNAPWAGRYRFPPDALNFSSIGRRYLLVRSREAIRARVLQIRLVARDLGEVHRDQENRRGTFHPGNEPTLSRGQGQAP